MIAVGRVLLWTVALVAPGGFLLVPVLFAASGVARDKQASGGDGLATAGLRERIGDFAEQLRRSASQLQRYWTKS